MKYDDDHVNTLLESLKKGEGRVRACQAARIDYQTFLNWLEGKIEFLEAVKKAENCGYDKVKDLMRRRVIEDKSWQSAAWYLERNFPNEYGIRQVHDVTTRFEGIDGERLRLSGERLRKIAEEQSPDTV